MKPANRDCRLLCEIQAKLFEKSILELNMGSEIFVRRFMNSRVAEEFDSGFFLDDTKTIEDVFDDLDAQYGKSSYGSKKYHRDVMYWAGYLYRYFAYTYEVSSRQAYRLLPLKYVAGSYEAYHTLDIPQAIERLLEAKGISFDEEALNRRVYEIYKRIRKEGKAA